MAAMIVLTTMVAMAVMAFVVAAIVAMGGSHVKETCSLLLEAMAAMATILEAMVAAMAAILKAIARQPWLPRGSYGCHGFQTHQQPTPSTGDPRPTKQNSSISTYVWLFPPMNHCGKKATCVEITMTCGFSQIHLGKTIDIHKWECPHECGKNHIVDQMIKSYNGQLI